MSKKRRPVEAWVMVSPLGGRLANIRPQRPVPVGFAEHHCVEAKHLAALKRVARAAKKFIADVSNGKEGDLDRVEDAIAALEKGSR